MTTKYYPPSVDDTGPSFTSDEIYDSEVGKKFTEALEEQRIEKCFSSSSSFVSLNGSTLSILISSHTELA